MKKIKGMLVGFLINNVDDVIELLASLSDRLEDYADQQECERASMLLAADSLLSEAEKMKSKADSARQLSGVLPV